MRVVAFPVRGYNFMKRRAKMGEQTMNELLELRKRVAFVSMSFLCQSAWSSRWQGIEEPGKEASNGYIG